MQQFDSLKSTLKHRPPLVFDGNWSAIETCPKQGGIYLIGVILETSLLVERPKLLTLQKGLYLYAGSAKGPEG